MKTKYKSNFVIKKFNPERLLQNNILIYSYKKEFVVYSINSKTVPTYLKLIKCMLIDRIYF